MKSKAVLASIGCCLGLALALSQTVVAQGGGQRGGGQRGGAPAAGGQPAAQPQGAREVTVTAIPGVIAAGAKWMLVWQGTDNADGLVGTADGGVLFAQEQPMRISKLDKNDKVSVFLTDTHGTGAVAIDSKGRILAAERTCTDPGNAGRGITAPCTEPTAIGVLAPEHKILADNIDGKTLGRVNDLVVDKKGGVYFNGGGTYYVSPTGKVSNVGTDVRSNGIMLSRDEKTLYVTSGGGLLAFDVQPDGSVTNQREFVKWEGGGGDGTTIDAEGRLYVTTGAGIQVVGPDGKYLGLIPTPRGVISVAFSGPDKKTVYVVGGGALGPDGQEFKTPEGVRNNGKTIYKIQMLAQGFKGRAK